MTERVITRGDLLEYLQESLDDRTASLSELQLGGRLRAVEVLACLEARHGCLYGGGNGYTSGASGVTRCFIFSRSRMCVQC